MAPWAKKMYKHVKICQHHVDAFCRNILITTQPKYTVLPYPNAIVLFPCRVFDQKSCSFAEMATTVVQFQLTTPDDSWRLWRPRSLTTPDDRWRPLTTPDDPWRPLTTLTTPDDSWRPLTTPDDPWRPLTTPDDPDDPWRPLTTPDDPWRPLTTPDDPWRPLTTPDDPWRPLTTADDPWRLLTTPDDPWRPLTTPDDPWRPLTDCHRRSLSVLAPLSLTFVRVLNVLVCRVDGREISTIYPTYSVERIALWGRRG